ncbi:MAG: S49 family peptidase [Chlamydiae bacterium]|nr:S49 family peptidase [Chlamydiota bacterium]
MNFTRESIFVSATRCLCNSFATVVGVAVAGAVILIGLSILSSPEIVPNKSDLVIAPDAKGNRTILAENSPVILRINIHGVIGEPALTAQSVENLLLDSREDLLRNNRVKAILLHVNTPGGTVDDADGIYRSLLKYKETYKIPVYAFVDGMCASGGMYVCSAADKIYATTPSVIGSVGVILGPSFNFSEVMDKIGIKSLTIKQGKDKDMLNPFRPWVPGEDQSLVNITQNLYENFVDIVTSARTKLKKQDLINTYGAQVFLSKQAQDYGYIDYSDSSYSAALTDLVSAANIDDTQPYQVVQLEAPTSLLSSLIQGKSPLISGKLYHSFPIGTNISSELSGKFLYLYQPN